MSDRLPTLFSATDKHARVALVISGCVFAGTMALSAYLLPNRVAAHFDLQGQPRGWVTRDTYLIYLAVLGVFLPVFTALMSLFIRVSPPQFFSLPHRDYWLCPEQRDATNAFFSAQLDWLASLLLIFMAGLNCLVVYGNRLAPVRLPGSLWLGIVMFLIAVHIWALMLVRRFSQAPPQSASKGESKVTLV